jgi:hypothetical protein
MRGSFRQKKGTNNRSYKAKTCQLIRSKVIILFCLFYSILSLIEKKRDIPVMIPYDRYRVIINDRPIAVGVGDVVECAASLIT